MNWKVVVTLISINGEVTDMVYQTNGDNFSTIASVIAAMESQDNEWVKTEKITLIAL